MEEQRPWHQLFGLSWQDFFEGTPASVEVERDMSQRQQFLDLELYQQEALPMPLTLAELRRQTEKEILAKTPPKEGLEGLTADDVLKALTPELRAALLQRLKEEEENRKAP